LLISSANTTRMARNTRYAVSFVFETPEPSICGAGTYSITQLVLAVSTRGKHHRFHRGTSVLCGSLDRVSLELLERN